MQDYKITLLIDGAEERTKTWSAFDEQGAVTRAFLYYAHAGARELKVLDITLK